MKEGRKGRRKKEEELEFSTALYCLEETSEVQND